MMSASLVLQPAVKSKSSTLRLVERRMSKAPLVWKAELGTAPDSAFSAKLGNLITYHVVTRTYGYPAYVEIHNRRGGLRRLDLGFYVTMEHAQQACERHYENGCDLSKAESSQIRAAIAEARDK